MMKIASRNGWVVDDVSTQAYMQGYEDAKQELSAELSLEMDAIVDKLSDFLEERIVEEFQELKTDIAGTIQENEHLKDKVSVLSTDNLKQTPADKILDALVDAGLPPEDRSHVASVRFEAPYQAYITMVDRTPTEVPPSCTYVNEFMLWLQG